MELSLIYALLSAIIYLSGFIPYIYHIYHGHVVPHPFSWTIGAILSAINTFGLMAVSGITASLAPTIMRSVCLMIWWIIWWFFIRKIKINTFDYFCLFLAVIAIGIAFFFWVQKAIIPTIIIDILVLSPTLKKIWIAPDSEDPIAWITTTISQFFLLLSLGSFSLETGLFWTYIMSVNALVAAFIILRIRYMKSWKYHLKKFFSLFALKNKL